MGRLKRFFEPHVASWGELAVIVVCDLCLAVVVGVTTHLWRLAYQIGGGGLLGAAIGTLKARRCAKLTSTPALPDQVPSESR